MDPNETLRLIRRELDALKSADDWSDLAEYVQALDDWLSRGGFPPEAWREGPDAFGEELPAGYDRNEAGRIDCPGCGAKLDTSSSHSRQHFIDTGYYLAEGVDPLGPPNPAHAELPRLSDNYGHRIVDLRDDDYTPAAIDRTTD